MELWKAVDPDDSISFPDKKYRVLFNVPLHRNDAWSSFRILPQPPSSSFFPEKFTLLGVRAYCFSVPLG